MPLEALLTITIPAASADSTIDSPSQKKAAFRRLRNIQGFIGALCSQMGILKYGGKQKLRVLKGPNEPRTYTRLTHEVPQIPFETSLHSDLKAMALRPLVLIAGASGYTGKSIVPALLESGNFG